MPIILRFRNYETVYVDTVIELELYNMIWLMWENTTVAQIMRSEIISKAGWCHNRRTRNTETRVQKLNFNTDGPRPPDPDAFTTLK